MVHLSSFRLLALLSILVQKSQGFVINPSSRVDLRTSLTTGKTRCIYSSTCMGLFSGDKSSVRDLNEKTIPELFPGEGVDPTAGVEANLLSLILLSAKDVLAPAAQILDDATDGWALFYADLSPEDETTPVGQAFLASNIAYAVVGLLLSIQGDVILGLLTEVVSVASFIYHYTQLQASSMRTPAMRTEDDTVRIALMVDYIFAFTSIFVGLIYLVSDQQLPPVEGFISAAAGLACLFACWVYEKGYPYIVLHSLWHLFSAYSAYAIGTSHLAS
jgi:hypothetical protein